MASRAVKSGRGRLIGGSESEPGPERGEMRDLATQTLHLLSGEPAHLAAGRPAGVARAEDRRELVDREADGNGDADQADAGHGRRGIAPISIRGTARLREQSPPLVEPQGVLRDSGASGELAGTKPGELARTKSGELAGRKLGKLAGRKSGELARPKLGKLAGRNARPIVPPGPGRPAEAPLRRSALPPISTFVPTHGETLSL